MPFAVGLYDATRPKRTIKAMVLRPGKQRVIHCQIMLNGEEVGLSNVLYWSNSVKTGKAAKNI
jgi:hypothetical protein